LLSKLADWGLVPGEDGVVALGPLAARQGLWLSVGGLSVQPSEVAKLALVLWAADVLARKGDAVADWRELMRPLFPVTTALLLLVGYHDLGTMLCLLMLFVGLLWAAAVQLRVFVAMGVVGLAGIAG